MKLVLRILVTLALVVLPFNMLIHVRGDSCTSEELTADTKQPVEIIARKFRIAPIPLELHEFDPRVLPVMADGSPDVNVVTLPESPAFPAGTRKVVFVQLHDRNCWGVLLAHKSWLRIPYGQPIPILTTRAFVDR